MLTKIEAEVIYMGSKEKLWGYDWVHTQSGKFIVYLAATTRSLEEIYHEFFSRWGLSETKFNALLLLYQAGEEGMAFWELGEKMLVTRANITGLMDRLEKGGLVKREVNPEDRRSLIAKLTEEAKELVTEILPEFKCLNEQVISVLDEEEKSQFINLLQKLNNGIARD